MTHARWASEAQTYILIAEAEEGEMPLRKTLYSRTHPVALAILAAVEDGSLTIEPYEPPAKPVDATPS